MSASLEFFFNGRYIDYLSLNYAINKNRILKVTLQILHSAREKTLETFKISIEILIIRTSHTNNNREGKKSVFHQFLFWPPSIAHTLSHQITWYIVVDGFYPWFRGGCTACSRGWDRFQCGEDVFPSNHAQRTIEILQVPFFLASLVYVVRCWLVIIHHRFDYTCIIRLHVI